MKVLFMGTPDFALPTFKAVREAGHKVQAVFTQPPRPSGRGLTLRPSPVARMARDWGLDVFCPTSLKLEDILKNVRNLAPDVAIVVAYGLLLPPAFLTIPRFGCLNLHASLLPRWRGAAPLNRAIMARDRDVGVSIMRLSEGLDEGPVCACEAWPLSPEETVKELHDQAAERGARLMIHALTLLENGTASFQEQSKDGVTYAKKIEKQEAKLCFEKPAEDVVAHIHGLSPSPGAWTQLAGSRLKILRAQARLLPFSSAEQAMPGRVLQDGSIVCGKGVIFPLLVQKEGKKPLDMASFLRGSPQSVGQRCGE